MKIKTLQVAALAATLYLPFSTHASPPLLGTSLFTCPQRDLIFSDYVKKTKNILEICKVRGGYSLTYGKYEDPFNTQIYNFKESDVEITKTKVTLEGNFKFKLEFSNWGEGTFSKLELNFEDPLETFQPDSAYLINNLNHFITPEEDEEEDNKDDKDNNSGVNSSKPKSKDNLYILIPQIN